MYLNSFISYLEIWWPPSPFLLCFYLSKLSNWKTLIRFVCQKKYWLLFKRVMKGNKVIAVRKHRPDVYVYVAFEKHLNRNSSGIGPVLLKWVLKIYVRIEWGRGYTWSLPIVIMIVELWLFKYYTCIFIFKLKSVKLVIPWFLFDKLVIIGCLFVCNWYYAN